MRRKLLAEFLGTFALVFAGTGAIVFNDVSHGAITHVGIALTFGLVVLTLIYTLGDVSGAHFNPAVSFGLAVAGRFPWRDVLPYVAMQLFGAFAASGLLKGLYPQHETLGATLPRDSAFGSFVLEVLLTAFLVFSILCVTAVPGEKKLLVGVAVGAVIALEALFAGPICGASMNPARSLAPAVVSGNLQHLWVYLCAPFVGALLGVPGCRFTQKPGCCPAQEVCQ